MTTFTSIKKAVELIKQGQMLVVVDDDGLDNDAKLVLSATFATEEKLHLLTKLTSGVIKLAVTNEKFQQLSNLKPNLNQEYDDEFITLGLASQSNQEKVHYLATLIHHVMRPSANHVEYVFNGPLPVVPSRKGGTLKRTAVAETIIDLCSLASLPLMGVTADLLDDKGLPVKLGGIAPLLATYNLPIIKISDLITYRRTKELLVERVAEAKMPTKHGEFKMIGFINKLNGEHHVALVKGDVTTHEPVLVRVHSECLTGDSFGSMRCDCGEQLQAALKRIEAEGRGVVLYMRQEGRGIGLINKIRAYALQDIGYDTVEANLALGFPDDLRDYGIGAQILVELGIKKVNLMTNNPRKIKGLSGYGLEIVSREEIQMNHNERNEFYMRTKKAKLDHILDFNDTKK